MAPVKVSAPLGLVGVALTFILQNLGLDRTAAMNASLLQGAVPVLTLLFATILLGERLGVRRLLSIGAVVVGVCSISLPRGGRIQMPGLGDLLVFGSAASFAIFIIIGRQAFPKYGVMPVLTGMTLWGTVALIPAAGIELISTRPTAIDGSHLGLAIYLGIGCSAVTYALWGYVLCHIDASRAATFDALIPAVGAAAAIVILHEPLSIWHLVGGTAIFTGVWLAVRETAAPVPAPIVEPVLRTAVS